MIFRQVIHEDLGCASYLVGDEDAGVAAVVDPKLDIEEYLALARYLGVRIEHVLETHNHADHVSGHGRLAAATGATIHIHRLAAPSYDHQPFDDGWELRLGDVIVRALHTPGHRPEHTAFALIDARRGAEPWAVLTGDTLFVGDIARPDLAVDKDGGRARDLPLAPRQAARPARDVRGVARPPRRLHVRRTGMDMKVSSTIGYEREHNALLALEDEDAFVQRRLATSGRSRRTSRRSSRPTAARSSPAASTSIPSRRARSRSSDAAARCWWTSGPTGSSTTRTCPARSATRGARGVRHEARVDRRPEQDVVLLGRDDEDAIHAAHLAAAVGVRRVAGHLAGGMTSWREEKRPTESVRRIDVAGLHQLGGTVQVLDVREQSEYDEGHIPGSAHVPYHDVDGIPEGLDPSRPIAVICASGQRSAVGASLLLRAGAAEVLHVADGGVGTWARRGWPIERAERLGSAVAG